MPHSWNFHWKNLPHWRGSIAAATVCWQCWLVLRFPIEPYAVRFAWIMFTSDTTKSLYNIIPRRNLSISRCMCTWFSLLSRGGWVLDITSRKSLNNKHKPLSWNTFFQHLVCILDGNSKETKTHQHGTLPWGSKTSIEHAKTNHNITLHSTVY